MYISKFKNKNKEGERERGEGEKEGEEKRRSEREKKVVVKSQRCGYMEGNVNRTDGERIL